MKEMNVQVMCARQCIGKNGKVLFKCEDCWGQWGLFLEKCDTTEQHYHTAVFENI